MGRQVGESRQRVGVQVDVLQLGQVVVRCAQQDDYSEGAQGHSLQQPFSILRTQQGGEMLSIYFISVSCILLKHC